MTESARILLLAGTFEARSVPKVVATHIPDAGIVASFAGAVAELPEIGVPTRIGGFGGIDGLTSYLHTQGISLVIDATHPFAEQMSRNASAACTNAGIPLIRLVRPAWAPHPSDTWRSVRSLDAAAAALPPGSRPLIAVGRKEIGKFLHRTDVAATVRMIEPPGHTLPPNWTLILARPGKSAPEEGNLLRDREITHVVSKNSGGQRSFAKIAAARNLKLPVIMIARPELDNAPTYESVEEIGAAALAILRRD